MSGNTNFTVVVNQSSDQHALFFGASVLEGNQSSSLLWDSNGTDMVSKRPGMINLQLVLFTSGDAYCKIHII